MTWIWGIIYFFLATARTLRIVTSFATAIKTQRFYENRFHLFVWILLPQTTPCIFQLPIWFIFILWIHWESIAHFPKCNDSRVQASFASIASISLFMASFHLEFLIACEKYLGSSRDVTPQDRFLCLKISSYETNDIGVVNGP